MCKGGTFPAQLKYKMLADMACERITAGITRAFIGSRPILALLDPYNPVGSTAHVNFNTSKTDRWETDSSRCHLNWVILDSDWEAEFCRVAEGHPRVCAYVKNHNLGLEVPYRYGSEMRRYLPDFIVLVDDGHGDDDLLHLVVEIKGYRGEDAKEKKATMETYWVPGVNHLGGHGRWDFAEFTEVYQIEADFKAKVEGRVQQDDRARRRRADDPGSLAMAKKSSKGITVETLTHGEATRKNIPTAEYQPVMAKDEQAPVPVAYERRAAGLEEEKAQRNRDLDPQLVWRGKDQQDWSDLVVHAPPIYIQEKVHPKVLIDDLLRQSRAPAPTEDETQQLDLFSDFNGIPKDADKTEFYRHDQNWSNRMILGDSLQVMASLAEREGLFGRPKSGAPSERRRGHGRCRQAFAPLADNLGEVGPGGDAALAAGLDDAGEQGEGTGALLGAGAHADAPGDNPVAQSPLSLVVAERHLGMVEHHPEGVPVVEHLAR